MNNIKRADQIYLYYCIIIIIFFLKKKVFLKKGIEKISLFT